MYNFKKINLKTIAFAIALSPFSIINAETDLQNVTQLLQQRIPAEVTPAVKTPVDGVYESSFANKFGYLLEQGRYVIIGEMFDLQTGENVTDRARKKLALETGKKALVELAKFTNEEKIIYPAIGDTKEVLTVFTDTSCPYCIKLHEEVPKLREAGIQVQYLPYPRSYKQGRGYNELRRVWCAKDRASAMHIAKGTGMGDLDNDGSCELGDVVDKGYEVGNKIGVTGTPASFTSKGVFINGYAPYQRLIPEILNP
ncbi:MAG: DsbC family protein [Bacteroidetes bacterium]|nr:DsbC family protein [Bacteroidota bacterium]